MMMKGGRERGRNR
jgi:hypothetical protein